LSLAKLTSKCQLTVPKRIREHLGLHAGDKVEFRIEHDGSARMLPVSGKVSDLLGMLAKNKKKKPVSVEEMDENMRPTFRKDPL